MRAGRKAPHPLFAQRRSARAYHFPNAGDPTGADTSVNAARLVVSQLASRGLDNGVERVSKRHVSRVPGQSRPHLTRYVGVPDAGRWIREA